MSELRNKLSQTNNAHIIPPIQKTKSRYQNIKIISEWGVKAIRYYKKNHKRENELCEKLKWVLEYKKFIIELDKLNESICNIEKIIKHNGLSKKIILKVKKQLKNLEFNKAVLFNKKLSDYLDHTLKQIPNSKKILCCSDIIESAFGKYKNYVSSNPMAGVTNLILCLSAFTSKFRESEIKNALENTPINKIKEWTQQEIGDTILKRRRISFSYA